MAKTPVMDATDLIAAVNKRFGEDSLIKGNSQSLSVTRWKSGMLPVDKLMDGGIPRGRFIECYGGWSSMKSFVLYKALGACQKQGGKVGLIDTEHSFDPEWAEKLGLDTDNILISRPDNAEQGIAVAESLVRQGYDMLGFDSIAAALPKQHQESAPGEDNQPGALARVMSKGLARLTAANRDTSIIFVNQTRSKIGISYGSPMTTSGGSAMGFYASYRLNFSRIGKVQIERQKWDGEKLVKEKFTTHLKIKISIEKSKLSAPVGDAFFLYDLSTNDVDELGYLIGLSLENGEIVQGGGGWLSSDKYLGTEKIQGIDRLKAHLAANPEIVKQLTDSHMSGIYGASS